MKPTLTAFALALTALAAQAESCADNFSAEGNVLTGKSYKTWADLPQTRPADALAGAARFTVENGFTVLSINKEMGLISAAQTVSYGKGKTVPLNVTVQPAGAGSRITLNYATSGGLMSPEEAIKRHFCMTVAAAAAAGASALAGPATAAAPVPADVGAAPRAAPTARGYAAVTAEQQAAISREIPKVVPTEAVRSLVANAAPAIEPFLAKLSCLADYTGASALNEYAAPGVDLQNTYSGLRPMRAMPYHNKASCLTVARVQGWQAPALNALKFEVLYSADDSGETAKVNHEVVRQPDGSWLFSR